MLFKRKVQVKTRLLVSDAQKTPISTLQSETHKKNVVKPRKGIENWFDSFEDDLRDSERSNLELTTDLQRGDTVTEGAMYNASEDQEIERRLGSSFGIARTPNFCPCFQPSSSGIIGCDPQASLSPKPSGNFFLPDRQISSLDKGDFLDLSSSVSSSPISSTGATYSSEKMAGSLITGSNVAKPKSSSADKGGIPGSLSDHDYAMGDVEYRLEHERLSFVERGIDAMLLELESKPSRPKPQCCQLALPPASPFVVRFSKYMDLAEHNPTSPSTSSLLNRRGRTLESLELGTKPRMK